MAEYKSYALGPQFNPIASIDNTSRLEAKSAKDVDAFARYLNNNRTIDQQKIEDSRFAGQNWKALANLIPSMVELGKQQAKRDAQSKLVGEHMDELYQRTENQAEIEAYNRAEKDAATSGEVANKLEGEGRLAEAENYRTEYHRGVANEKALLTSARSRFAADLTQMVNSTEEVIYQGAKIKLNELYRISPADALRVATSRWVEKNKLQYTTKEAFVNILGPTIRETQAYMATNAVNETLKAEKGERLAEVSSTTYAMGQQVTDKDATDYYQQQAQILYEDNNGILTKDAANRKAATLMFQGAAAKSTDQLTIVGNASKVIGPDGKPQKGTDLKTSYPVEYKEAWDNAVAQTDKDDKLFYRNGRDKLFSDLEKIPPGDTEKRIKRVNEFTEELQRRGMFEEAYAIQTDTDKFVASPEATANFARLQRDAANGRILTDAELNDKVASGDLTATQATSLRTQRNQLIEPAVKDSKEVTTSLVNETAATLKVLTGAEFDPTLGNFIGSTKEDLPMTKSQLNTVIKDLKLDLTRNMNAYAQTLDPNMNPGERRQKINAYGESLIERWTTTPTGKYFLGGVFTLENQDELVDPKVEKAIEQGFAEYSGSEVPSLQPTNFRSWAGSYPNGVTAAMKNDFKLGDAVVGPAKAESITEAASKSDWDIKFIQTAKDLGVTPYMLLKSNREAWGLDPMGTPTFGGSRQKKGKPGQADYRTYATQGINDFLSLGFSVKGAAYLSAYLYLKAAERKEDIFNNKNYALTYAQALQGRDLLELFRNANATDRQLKAAIISLGGAPSVTSYANALLQQAGIK